MGVAGYAGIEAGISASDKAGVGNWLGWRLCQHSDAQNGTGQAQAVIGV